MIAIGSLVVDYVDNKVLLGGVFNAPSLYDKLVIICNKKDQFLVENTKCKCIPGRTLRVYYQRKRDGDCFRKGKRYEIVKRECSGNKVKDSDILPLLEPSKVLLIYEYEDHSLKQSTIEKIVRSNSALFVVVATRWPEKYVKLEVVTISNSDEMRFMPIATGDGRIMYNGFLPVGKEKLRTNVGCGDVFAMYFAYYLEITSHIRLSCSLAHEKTVDFLS